MVIVLLCAAALAWPTESPASAWQVGRVKSAILQVAGPLESYRAEYGAYPETVHLMVPDYSPHYPRTPLRFLTGQFWSYASDGEGYVLSSQGAQSD